MGRHAHGALGVLLGVSSGGPAPVGDGERGVVTVALEGADLALPPKDPFVELPPGLQVGGGELHPAECARLVLLDSGHVPLSGQFPPPYARTPKRAAFWFATGARSSRSGSRRYPVFAGHGYVQPLPVRTHARSWGMPASTRPSQSVSATIRLCGPASGRWSTYRHPASGSHSRTSSTL